MEVKTKRKKKGQSNIYFTQDTENAIIKYNNSVDDKKRDEIFRKEIYPAFFKLTEYIINTYKIFNTGENNISENGTIINIQSEVIQFLHKKIHLFDSSKGAKAYSYFGTIAKRYLILASQGANKTQFKSTTLSIIEEDEKYSYQLDDVESDTGEAIDHKSQLSKFMDKYIDFCTINIFEIFPKETDAKVADAILELFRKRENLDVFNKKALYIYIREMVDVKTPKITQVGEKLHNIFKEKYIFYLENGYTNF
jgi:hypothetical protein